MPHSPAPPHRTLLHALLALLIAWLCLWAAPANAQGSGTTSMLGQSASQVAAGGHHSCALTQAGAVQCWGSNNIGQTTVPAALQTGGAATITTGPSHSCALTQAGTVQCWGRNVEGQTTVPTTLQTGGAAAIATGYAHSCALTQAGAVQCWGRNVEGQTTVPTTLQTSGAKAIATGNLHSCALTPAGAVQCWGRNAEGQAPSTLRAGQSLAFAPGQPGQPLPTLALDQPLTLLATASGGGTTPITYATWTPGTCSVSGNTLTPTASATAGSLCGVFASRAGEHSPAASLAAAPQPMRLLAFTQATPTLTLSASPAGTSTLDTEVTLTATLVGGASPTGAITFATGAAPLCTVTLPAATCTARPTVGTHAITASYAGDANNYAATAPALTHTVAPASLPLLPGVSGSAQVNIASSVPGCTVDLPPTFAAATNLAGATAPLGALSFTSNGCTGATLSVAITYPAGSLAGLTPYKYGPTSAGQAPSWFPHGTVSGDTVTYQVTDDGTGDNNTTTPGVIDDPHAMLLAAPPGPGGAAPIPTLSEWGLMLMSPLTAALGLVALRRRGGLPG